MNPKVLVAGGTGFVGQKLIERLHRLRYDVHVLSRSKRANTERTKYFQWNPAKGEIPAECLEGVSAVVNLTGRGVADKRWSDKFKQELIDSRVQSTRLLVKNVNRRVDSVNTFVNASAIGFYGFDRGEEELSEESAASVDFFGQLCSSWEAEMKGLDEEVRSAIFRIGVVLAKEEGAYPKLKTPISLGVGSALGSGKQYMSWIHIDDLVNALIWAIENDDAAGVYNAVAPNPVQNRHLTGKIANSLNKVILLPAVPGFMLKLIAGELAKSLLGSLRVYPKRLEAQGFRFVYQKVDEAVRQLNWG